MKGDDATRAEVLCMFRDALPGHAIHWTSERSSLGDFEGRDVTLEVFDVPDDRQRQLVRDLRVPRAKAAELLGSPVQLVFHDPDATTRHYSWAREEGTILELDAIVTQHLHEGLETVSDVDDEVRDTTPLLTPDGLPRRSTGKAA